MSSNRQTRTGASDRKQLQRRALAKATKYEKYAGLIGDPETARSILQLAWKLRKRAEALGKQSENRIRRRARQIWIENGRPSGRDEEFWLRAERELRDGDIEAA